MEHNLDDHLREFDPKEDTMVSQPEIILDNSTDQNPSMEFDQITERPMETGYEEIIVPEFVDQQFVLGVDGEEYTFQDNQPVETVVETTPSVESSQSDMSLDVQFAAQTFIAAPSKPSGQHVQGKPHFIAIKPSPQSTGLRHVAIAPKPLNMKNFVPVKRPATQPFATTQTVKKVSLSNVMQASKGSVLAQIGKQLVMIPAGGQQKIKLMKSDGKQIQGQFLQTNPVNQKTMMAKVIVQGQQQLESRSQSAVLSKVNAAGAPPRYVTLQQKTVPISMANSVIMASPTKQGVSKPQQIVIASPQKKFIAKPPGTKKFIITMNPDNTAKPATPQKQVKKAITSEAASNTQIHQINVPGKGVQYIKLVTNNKSGVTQAASPAVTTVPSVPTVTKREPTGQPIAPKTIVLTDNKGTYIQMKDGKVVTSQAMVVTSGPATKVVKTSSGSAKLVRIAPVGKVTQKTTQAAQSLLSSPPRDPLVDSKDPLRALVAELGEPTPQECPDVDIQTQEIEISYERRSSLGEDESTFSADELAKPELTDAEHPLRVTELQADRKKRKKPRQYKTEEFQVDEYSINQSELMEPMSPQPESDEPALDLRPRKLCNCTKSQCLKLYCDCFANGEFCNGCNCTNCHNNLQHEELRQKAIRGCLERNPNAFRPKIGKTKAGAVEVTIRRHNKGCNCKRSGCLKNYCECYEAKIACTSICKCYGCRNVEDALGRRLERAPPQRLPQSMLKQPRDFMTSGEVVDAVCQCMVAAAEAPSTPSPPNTPSTPEERDPIAGVLEEFLRCMQDVVNAAQQGPPVLVETTLT